MIKKQIFGLDISDHSIEALVLSKAFFGKPKVDAYARTILRGEVVKDGKIKNEEKLQENIRKLLESAKPKEITTKYCIISIPESQVFTTVFKFPAGLKKKEIQNTIPYKAEEVIPFKSSEIYYDFKTIATVDETQEVYYVAVPIKVIDSYVAVLEGMGLKPVAFDLESNSLARSLIGSTNPKDGKLIIDIGSRTTNLNIYDRNGVRQSLSIKSAGDKFTKAIAKAMSVTPKQAEELKVKTGFDPAQKNGKVLLVLQKEFKRIVEESQKLIEFYQSESHRQVTQAVLVGGSALLPKVDQYLADNLGIEVVLGDPAAGVMDPQKLLKPKSKSLLFSNVIGLGMRAVSKDPNDGDINLLPVMHKKFAIMPRREEKKAWRFIYIRLFILMLSLLGLLAVFYMNNHGKNLYDTFVPGYDYNSNVELDVDLELLDSLRNEGSETATSTEELLPQFEVTIRQTTAGFLNVRSGPGTDYDIVTRADSGAVYPWVDEEDDWYEIQINEEETGWVSSTFADKAEIIVEEEATEDGEVLGASNEEENSEEVQEVVVEKIKVLETSVGYLNVRSEPSTASEKIGEVNAGEEYEIADEDNDWYQIILADGNLGWVSSVYVDKL